jgi:hypothetical protein
MHYPALLSSALAIATANGKHRQCKCGAIADPLTGVCRKCHGRNAWRRKTTTPRRKSNRHRLARRVHDVARVLADVLAIHPTICEGTES